MTHGPDLARRPRGRPVSLGDALILVAAVGLALAFARPLILAFGKGLHQLPYARLRTWADWRGFLFGKFPYAVTVLWVANSLLSYLVVALIPAFLLMRLRRPRPTWGALARQPGFAGCVAIVGVFLALLAADWMGFGGPGGPYALLGAGPAAWIILVATRRWGPEPGWLDGLGRALVAAWVVSFLGILFLNPP